MINDVPILFFWVYLPTCPFLILILLPIPSKQQLIWWVGFQGDFSLVDKYMRIYPMVWSFFSDTPLSFLFVFVLLESVCLSCLLLGGVEWNGGEVWCVGVADILD